MSTTSEPRLKDRLFNAIRAEDKSLETAKAYWHWIEKFIRYHGIRHPKEMGESEVRDFLSSLAAERNYAPATQDVAYNALAYLYQYVLDRPLDQICNLVRSRKPKRLPEVFTIDEVARVFGNLTGWCWLAVNLMYGGGLRVGSCMNLRIKDVRLDALQLVVRQPKGRDDYLTILPKTIISALREHLEQVRHQHSQAAASGYGGGELPYAMARKYPNGTMAWEWQYVFPAPRPSRDPATGAWRRHHLDKSNMQKTMSKAVSAAGITRNCGCHALRHSFATHLVSSGVDVRTVQKLMGHKDIKTTEVYLHVSNINGTSITSPADRLRACA